MKPLRILTPLILGSAVLATALPAQAGDRFSLSIGTPSYYAPAPVYYQPTPVYYQPAPVYYGPSYRFVYANGWDRHRNYNWGYWNRGRGHGHGHGHGRGHGHHR